MTRSPESLESYAIKLEKSAAKERDERLRWERAYAAKLSHRVN